MTSSATHEIETPMRHTLEHAGLFSLMAFIMLLLYLGGFHHPAPHDLELAVVSENTGEAEALESKLQSALGDGAHLRTLTSPDEAAQLLRDREIEGAYIPSPNEAVLMTASAASATTADAVTKIFLNVAQAQSVPLAVKDIVPVADNDPVVQNAFFFLATLSVGSYATSIAISAAGTHLRFRTRALLAAAAAVVIASLFTAVASAVFSLFDAHLTPT
ncbi:hypothetical protein M3F30_03635 [Corynebacterium sanguinis]|uniref:hypothetical protein n=1 Tax=Corynebacterium sanguinis TaxID=2594913 RepID=UPI00223B04C1|nr:hypothetical protein [Corynebacterium sanguinis]MCT2287678.1 hypothetical protein [Corynebacterium sanguinis]